MEKATQTHVETIEFTAAEARAWPLPPFQRGLKVNHRVKGLSDKIKADDGVVPGIICFGLLEKKQWLIDGQQRREAFLLSEKAVGYADARFCKFDTMAAMAREFVNLNSHLVSMKPDDILRGYECSLPNLRLVREGCPFVGYNNVRRGDRAPVLSMSVLLRAWAQSAPEVPGVSCPPSATLAEVLTAEEARQIVALLNLCWTSWGRDVVYQRLWHTLNLTLCAWLYRRLVVTPYSAKTQRLSPDHFQKCLMALSADAAYVDWLHGRHNGDRDRAPGYARIKQIFAARLAALFGKKPMLPAPAWAHSGGRPR